MGRGTIAPTIAKSARLRQRARRRSAGSASRRPPPAVYSRTGPPWPRPTRRPLTFRARSYALLLAVAPALHAQAPVITAKGDPSIASDTIYRLAKDAEKSGRGYVILLDDGVVRVDAHGRGTRTFRTVVLVNDVRSVFDWRFGYVTYDPTYVRVRLNWARIVRPDGSVVSPEPYLSKDDFRPPEGDRGYYHDAELRWLLKGVEPGTIVDYSVTEESDSMPRGLEVPGGWRVARPGVLIKRSRFILDASDSLHVRFVEDNLGFARHESAKDGRHVYSWITTDAVLPDAEPYATDSSRHYPNIRFRTDTSWIDVGRWYADRGLAHLTLGKLGQQRYSEITHGAATHADTIAAIYHYAVQGVNTLESPPARAGFVPWLPDKTVEEYRGDSQDKSALLVAMLRRAGVDAAFVLAATKTGLEEAEPSATLLQGALVRVVQGHDTMFVDPASRWLPPGVLPTHLAGALAVVIDSHDAVTITHLPRPAPGEAAVARHTITGTIDATGSVTWRHAIHLGGTAQEYARRSFRLIGDSTSHVRAAELKLFAMRDLPNAEGSDLTVFDPRDLLAPADFSFTVHSPPLLTRGNRTLLPLSFADFTGSVAAAEYLQHHLPRAAAVDIRQLVGDSTVSYDVRLTLPDGWMAMLPPDVNSTGEFGTVVRTYAQDGRELHLTQTVIGARGTLPASRVNALIDWLRSITLYRSPYIVLMHAGR